VAVQWGSRSSGVDDTRERDRRGRLTRRTDARASLRVIEVPVQPAHELTAVLMAEMLRDVLRVQFQHVLRVPHEVMPVAV
jgi:hypothetical protein